MPRLPWRYAAWVTGFVWMVGLGVGLGVGRGVSPGPAQAGQNEARLPGAQSFQFTVAESRVFLPPAELIDLDNPAGGAIVRHDVTATVDPATGHLDARDRITVVHAPETPASASFPILLWKGLDVHSVEAWAGFSDLRPEAGTGSPPVPMSFGVRDGMHPRSFWRRPPYDALGGYENARQIDLSLAADATDRFGAAWPETLQIEVVYAGVIADSLVPPAAAYARSFETTPGLICNDGVFLASSSFWVPSRPNDVFTFGLKAHVPDGWRAVSQGGLIAGAGFDAWHCPHPMEEIYLVAGPWTLHEIDHGTVKAQTFTYADTDSSVYNRYLRGTARYLDLYEEMIGPYPFAKFALVENFWQTGYGMPSFTLLGDRVIRLPFILDTSYGHEVLHNWWGNGVFVERGAGNWCEGLTTYGADYLYKEREGAAAAREYRLNALKSYRDYVSDGEDRPLRSFTERHDFASQAIGYSKSMMVIHQLRREAGEAAFWTGLRNFYREHLWERATWTDLIGSIAAVGAKNPLQGGAFHAQWIDRAGAPLLGVESVTVQPVPGASTGVAVGALLHFELVQEATDAGDPFRVLVPVRARGSNDGEVAEWSVLLEGMRLPVVRELAFVPQVLEVDPDFEVMRAVHRSEIPASLSQTLGADTVVVVIGSEIDPAGAQAFAALAAEWDQGQALAVLEEAELTADWVPSTAVWYLGMGPRARQALEVHGSMRPVAPGSAQWMAESQSIDEGWSWVAAGASAEGLPWVVIDAADAALVPVVGAKVPHYGRYSYLAFDGATNVAKGAWEHTASPLEIDLTSRGF